MRTIEEIRYELKFAKDNGLTVDEIEALEIEMYEVEDRICEEYTMGIETVRIYWSNPNKHIKGKLVRTKEQTYIITTNGNHAFQIHRMYSNNHYWNRQWDVEKGTLKGAAGLPKSVLKLIC